MPSLEPIYLLPHLVLTIIILLNLTNRMQASFFSRNDLGHVSCFYLWLYS